MLLSILMVWCVIDINNNNIIISNNTVSIDIDVVIIDISPKKLWECRVLI